MVFYCFNNLSVLRCQPCKLSNPQLVTQRGWHIVLQYVISAVPIKAAEMCPKNVECEPHANKVERPAFQEKFGFQVHQWF